MRPLFSLAVLVVLPSLAAGQTYTDKGQFLAACGPLGAESFECLPAGDPASSSPIAVPAFTLTIHPAFGSTLAPMNVQAAPSPSGPHATDGTRFVQVGATSTTNGQFQLTIAFAAPVTEFGFTCTDFGEYTNKPGQLTATVNGLPYVLAQNPPTLPDGSERFWGLRTPGAPFASVVLSKSTEGDGMGLDELLYSDLGLPDQCTATWTNLGFSKPGVLGPPQLIGLGQLAAGSSNELDLSQARPSASAILVFGLAQLIAPFKGGTMVPQPLLFITLPTSPSGSASLPFAFPPGLPAGTALYFQFWMPDPAASGGYASSNGLRGTTS